MKKRDEYEQQNMGRYRKIYPVTSEDKMKKYEEYLRYAEKTYFSENNFIRAEIQAEKEKEKTTSKKNLSKKKSTIIDSPKPIPRTHHSLSEKQIDETKIKNNSVEMFKK